MKESICDICNIQDNIAGQAFTKYTCLCCEKQYYWSNTGTPKLCNECGKKSKRCIYCLATLKKNKLSDEFREQYRKMKDNKYSAFSNYNFDLGRLLGKIKKQCGL